MKIALQLLRHLIALVSLIASVANLRAQGTAFTYQGRLDSAGSPANGIYDLQFTIYDSTNDPGVVIAGPLTNANTAVSNGLFAVTLDFGNQFPGADRWLEIGVRTNGAGVFTALVPRQPLTPTPYAITAGNLLPGGLPAGSYGNAVDFNNSANQFAGSFAGNGGGLSNVNAATLGGLASGNFWQTTGNTGTTPGTHFLGTTDNQPMELRVNNQRVLHISPTASNDTVNVVGGSSLNYADPSVIAVTIAGGGTPQMFGEVRSNSVASDFATVGGGIDNQISLGSPSAVIAGGFHQRIGEGSADSTIGGGANNTVRSNSWRGTVGGGFVNLAAAPEATVAGGAFNSALGFSATIGGGGGNTANGAWSTIAGGRDNVLTNADYATIGGGQQNNIQSNAYIATIGGGVQNRIETNAAFSTIGGGALNVVQSNAYRGTVSGGWVNTIGAPEGTVAGGAFNSALGFSATVGGGGANTARGDWATIAGGRDNLVEGAGYAVIGGGYANTNSGLTATVAGGQQNIASGIAATVPGGYSNLAGGDYSFAAGQHAQANHHGTFVWADNTTNADFASTADNQFLIRAGFVGINRATRISESEYFGVHAPVTNIYGGMYIETASTGKPFYGYAQAGAFNAWTYVDGTDGNKWKLYNSGDRLTVTTDGRVGINNNNPGTALDVNGTVTATGFAGPGAGLTGVIPADNSVNALKLADGSVGTLELVDGSVTSLKIADGQVGNADLADNSVNSAKIADDSLVAADLASDVSSLDKVSGGRLAVGGNRVILPSLGAIDTSTFSGLGLQYFSATGEGAIMSSFDDGFGFLSFYTKGGAGLPVTKQMIIERYGGFAMDQGNANNGVLNHSSAAGVGLTFGLNSGEGVASKRTAGGNQFGLDLYTGSQPRLSIANGGNIGIGTTNPQGNLHVYSANNPTVLRVQSTGTPGFGRLEFVSNPQGDINEWRPGYIQSTDNGGFVGGLAFFVNGAGAGNKFGSNEVMRVVNGAVGIGTTAPVSALQVVGTVTATAFNPPSDRNLKENFQPVSPQEVLDKVAALPISRWNFKGDAATRHVGPMAQDFHAAFSLGTDDKHIATVDADGVALAAIQGLNQKLEQKETEIAKLQQRLTALEQLVSTLKSKGE